MDFPYKKSSILYETIYLKIFCLSGIFVYISRTKSERAFTKVSFISFLLKAFLQRTNYFTAFVSLR